MRQDPRLLPDPLGLRAAHVRARAGRGRTSGRGVHARLLPARAGALRRGNGDEAVARDAEEPQAAQAARALPGGQDQAFLQARHPETRRALPARSRLLMATAAAAREPAGARDPRVGEVYLTADQIAARVAELGAQITEDYSGREPLLVGLLKASVVFLADLTRAIPIVHAIDFVELAGYEGRGTGGDAAIRLLKDLDTDIAGRDVLLVEDVVDTGLT